MSAARTWFVVLAVVAAGVLLASIAALVEGRADDEDAAEGIHAWDHDDEIVSGW